MIRLVPRARTSRKHVADVADIVAQVSDFLGRSASGDVKLFPPTHASLESLDAETHYVSRSKPLRLGCVVISNSQATQLVGSSRLYSCVSSSVDAGNAGNN